MEKNKDGVSSFDTKTVGSFSLVKEETDLALEKIEKLRNSPITTKARNIVFAGLVLSGLFFMSLFMFQILTGVVALVTSVLLLGGLFLGVRFIKTLDPLIKQKTKNLLIDKMFKEAREKSVAQLSNHVLLNAEKLQMARKARDDFGGKLEQLKSKIDFNDNENQSNKKKKEIYERVNKAYQQMLVAVDRASEEYREFEKKVIEYKELDAFTQIAGEAMALFENGASAKLNEMLSLESFEHIDSQFNASIISIENSARDMEIDNG